MPGFANIQTVVVSFTNRDGVPTALVIDGTLPDSDLFTNVVVDEDGLTASISLDGIVPNGIGYEFRSLEDWELKWVRSGADVRSRPEPKPLGKVGQTIITVVFLAILAPFVGILWAWAGEVFRSFG